MVTRIQTPSPFANAQIDFSKIGQLADSYFKAQEGTMKRQAFQEDRAAKEAERQRQAQIRNTFSGGLPTGPDGQIDFAAMAKAIAPHDPNQAASWAGMASEEADRSENRQHRKDQLNIQRQQLAQNSTPASVREYKFYSDQEKAAGRTPMPWNDYRRQGGAAPRRSVTEMKQIYEADDAIPKINNTINTLKYARNLITKDPNDPSKPLAYEGTGAGTFGYIGSRVPGGDWIFDSGRSAATDEYGTIMSMEAIKEMANTLKGVTTDFELRKFEEVLADPTQPREIRQRTIDRMLQLAEYKRQLEERRAQEIRTGEYYGPGGFEPSPQAGSDQALQSARDAIARGASREAVIQRLRENGIDPSGL